MRYIKLIQNDASLVFWRCGAVGFILSVRSSLCSIMYFKNHRFIEVFVCVKLKTWWKLDLTFSTRRNGHVTLRLIVWVPLQLSLHTVYSVSVVSLASRAKPGTPPPVATPLTQIAFDSVSARRGVRTCQRSGFLSIRHNRIFTALEFVLVFRSNRWGVNGHPNKPEALHCYTLKKVSGESASWRNYEMKSGIHLKNPSTHLEILPRPVCPNFVHIMFHLFSILLRFIYMFMPNSIRFNPQIPTWLFKMILKLLE